MSIVIAVVVVIALLIIAERLTSMRRGATTDRDLADARAAAPSWIDRLGGRITMLSAGENVSARQALADASERHACADRELVTATSVAQVATAQRSAVEGLYYIRAARTALDMDPGPALPTTTRPEPAGPARPVNAGPGGWPGTGAR